MFKSLSQHTNINSWHGDIKPDNILLVGEHFKLVDFGFTEFKKVEEESRDPPRARLRGGTDAYGKFVPDYSTLLRLTIR